MLILLYSQCLISRMSQVLILLLIFVAILAPFVVFIVRGFCDYDNFMTPNDRGTYQFSETMVGKIVKHKCEFGNQILSSNQVGQVSRTCVSNRAWDAYNGQECASMALRMLRNTAQVSASSISVWGISEIWFYSLTCMKYKFIYADIHTYIHYITLHTYIIHAYTSGVLEHK